MVYVEKKVVDDAALFEDELFSSIRNQLCTFREGTDTSHWIYKGVLNIICKLACNRICIILESP